VTIKRGKAVAANGNALLFSCRLQYARDVDSRTPYDSSTTHWLIQETIFPIPANVLLGWCN